MDEKIADRIKQAEEQVAFWGQQEGHAHEQVVMWRGALAALRGLVEEAAVEPATPDEAELIHNLKQQETEELMAALSTAGLG